jgi:magnesium transporter
MPDRDNIAPWKQITDLVKAESGAALHAYLDTLSSGDVARAMTRLEEAEQHQVLVLLGPDEAADLIEELADAQAADIIEDLPVQEAAAIVAEMESDERADLLGEMEPEDAEAILQQMDPEEAEDARLLLRYDEETAGGVMVTEFVVYRENTLVREVVEDLRSNAERYADYGVHYAYVQSQRGTLVGVVRFRDLLLSPPDVPLQSIMIVNPIYVLAETPLEELDDFFDRYSFFNVPVTDEEGRMVGVVRRADMEQAVGEAQERAFLKFSGIIGGEELRSMPLSERVSKRLAWLGLNVLLSILAASVLLVFEETALKFYLLIFFIPVVGNMSGCSGNQSVAVSIRELTLGVIQPRDFMRVWMKELWVGLINGAVLGSVVALVAVVLGPFLWNDSPFLGLAILVGIAFMLNTVVAVSLGGLIPLGLRALKIDPAIAAPPLLTTLTDMMGLLLVFGLVTLALAVGWLPG